MRNQIAAACSAVALLLGAGPGEAQPATEGEESIVHRFEDLTWSEPEALPPGAELSLLKGSLEEEGERLLYARLPPGYVIPRHTHPSTENVTVLRGTLHLEADEHEATLHQGGFFSMPPGHVHALECTGDEDCLISVGSSGRFAIEYEDPADDPRLAEPQEGE